MIDLHDYYSGGYFLIRSGNPGWPQLKNGLLPEKLISLSTCICHSRLSIGWGWNPGDKQAALNFGIADDKWDEFKEWCHQAHYIEIDVWSMFFSPDIARRFVARFLSDTNDLFIIGVGLHRELEELHWIKRNNDELCGVEKRIPQHLPLESDGVVLGFEAVSYSYNDFGCSWLCSGLDRDMYDLFGIRPNQHGLIDTYEEAKKVHDWIAEDDMQGRRSEPEPYDAWLLVSYPLNIN